MSDTNYVFTSPSNNAFITLTDDNHCQLRWEWASADTFKVWHFLVSYFEVFFGISFERLLNLVVVVITPSLPRDGGTARTATQVHAVNLIEIRLRKRWQPISNQS